MPVVVQSQVPTIHGAEKHRDVDEATMVKNSGKDEVENHRLMTLKATEGQLKIKFEAGDRERAVEDASDWSDTDQLARKDEFEAEQDIPVVHQEQTSTLQADTQKAVARRQHKHNNHQQLARQEVQQKMGEGEKEER